MPRGGVDSLGQDELHFAGEIVEPQHEAELPLSSAGPDLFGERRQRAHVLEIDLHSRVTGFGSLVEGDEFLYPHLYSLAVGFGLDIE